MGDPTTDEFYRRLFAAQADRMKAVRDEILAPNEARKSPSAKSPAVKMTDEEVRLLVRLFRIVLRAFSRYLSLAQSGQAWLDCSSGTARRSGRLQMPNGFRS